MAAIAEQEKLKNINMEKQLQALGPPSTLTTGPVLSPVKDLQQALQEKDKQGQIKTNQKKKHTMCIY